MKQNSEKIRKGYYKEVYEDLERKNFTYTIDNIVKCLPNLNSKEYYCFLMYSISRKETAEKHLAICDVLMFMDLFFDDNYSLIKWHILQTIMLFPNYMPILQWAVSVFHASPDSPFEKQELLRYAEIILLKEPKDKLAQELINENCGH